MLTVIRTSSTDPLTSQPSFSASTYQRTATSVDRPLWDYFGFVKTDESSHNNTAQFPRLHETLKISGAHPRKNDSLQHRVRSCILTGQQRGSTVGTEQRSPEGGVERKTYVHTQYILIILEGPPQYNHESWHKRTVCNKSMRKHFR